MAILTQPALQEQRNAIERSGVPINYNRTQVNLALQAVEDFFTANSTKTAISNAIEGVTPGVFTAAQKLQITKAVLIRLTARIT